MNLGEIKTALKRYGFDDGDPLLTWINAALHDLEMAYNWPFLEKMATIVVSTATVTLPADFLQMKYAKIDGQASGLDYMSTGAWNRWVMTANETGIPENYTIVGMDVMGLWPIPDVARNLTIHYRSQIVELVSDGNTPAIPKALHYPLVQGAAAIGLQAENEEDRAASEATLFRNAIDQAIMTYTNRQTGQPAQVADVQEYAT